MDDNTAQVAHDPDEQNIPDAFQRRLQEAATRAAHSDDDDEPEDGYQPYRHAQEGREEEGLTFYHDDGVITVKFYTHLTDLICASSSILALIYMDCVYTLHGRNLDQLLPLLKRYKLDALYCFNEQTYAEPIEGVVIYHIVRESHAKVAERRE